MSSLTDTASATRLLIKIGLICLIAFIGCFYLYKLLRATIFATPSTKNIPTLRFGKIPKPRFPENAFENPTYSLETNTGGLPAALDRLDNIATVHALRKPKVTFTGKQALIKNALAYDFVQLPKQIDNETYEFTDSQYPVRKLVGNSASMSFKLTYDYTQDPTVLNSTNVPTEEGAIGEANQYLNSWNTLPDDLRFGEKKATLLEYNPPQLLPVKRRQQANAVRVDFFRQAINSVPVLFASPDESPIYVLIGTQKGKQRFIEAQYAYYEITAPAITNFKDKRDPNATYPLKPISQAYKELEEGQAYIAKHNGADAVSITETPYLALYEDQETLYLYPIYVFAGENFTAYVTAVNEEYLVEDKTTNSASPRENRNGNQESVRGASTQQSLSPSLINGQPLGIDQNYQAQPKRFSDLLLP